MTAPPRKRLAHLLRDLQWSIVGALVGVSIVLGAVGFWKWAGLVGEPRSVLSVFYLTLQLFTLESGALASPLPWELDIARFLAPAVAAYAVAKAVAILFHERLQWLRVRFMKGHVVICGLGRKGLLLAKAFREHGFRVVVVDQEKENSRLDQCAEDGAVVLVGNAMDRVVLRKAGVARARHLVAVCGADSRNAEVAVQAWELWRHGPSTPLDVHVHIGDTRLTRILTEKSLTTQPEARFRIQYFNTFESGARALLERFPPPAPKEPKNGSTTIVVVGFGGLGENFVIQAAQHWAKQYGYLNHMLRVKIVDGMASKRAGALLERAPSLKASCKLVSLDIEVVSPDFDRANFLQDPDGPVQKIYVCLDDDLAGLSAGLSLVRKVRADGVAVVVRLAMARESSLATLLRLSEDDTQVPSDLQVFGLLENACTLNLVDKATIEVMARAIHENYLKMLDSTGTTPQTHPAMKRWEDLDEGYRESNRQQAAHLAKSLRRLGYYVVPRNDIHGPLFDKFPDEHIEVLAEREHDRWADERVKAGWTWGKTRSDPEKKHPDLVPWSELRKGAQEKDRNAVRAFPAVLAEVGFDIVQGQSPAPGLTDIELGKPPDADVGSDVDGVNPPGEVLTDDRRVESGNPPD